MGNISKNLQSKYFELWPKIKNRHFKLERDKYIVGLKCIKKQNGKNNFDVKKLPCIEVSNRLFEDSPILFVGMNPSGTDTEHYSDKNNNPDDVYIYHGDSKYYEAMTSFASYSPHIPLFCL